MYTLLVSFVAEASYVSGIVMWEVLTQQDPWEHLPDDANFILALADALERNERPLVPNDCPPSYRNLLCATWATEPSARPSFQAILASDCLQSADPQPTSVDV
jgi:hypothetical protein